ncbi:hypothetical protein [Promicromonospora sp. NPDC059942]|uniref:hypothetical protein n=1 Tax=Promicromonospora sp. NPDC059942 TaxID=3347009 RepID=UPI0036606957
MGYVQRTPAWAGPLGAKDRTTYWGVVPLRPEGPDRSLPPHPDDVPPAGTFGDWYDVACGYLWRAEQVDLSLARLCAGGLLVLLQLVGLLPLVQLAASALPGLSVAAPAPWAALAGAILLAVVWTGWAVYRRRWNRAWVLRKAWSWAIDDPRVLALPARPLAPGEERDVDTDPEMAHPYRARSHVWIEDRPFAALMVGGAFTDRVRRREVARLYLLVVVPFMATVGVAIAGGQLWWEPGPGQYVVLIVAWLLALLPPVVGAFVRFFRRISLSSALARAETEERHRWMGWQQLHGVVGSDAPAREDGLGGSTRPRDARRRPPVSPRALRADEKGARTVVIFGAALGFGIFGLVAVLAALTEPGKALTFAGGLALVALVCGALVLWHRSGRQPVGRAGGGFVVRVEVPDLSPVLMTTAVPQGDATLTFSDGRAHLFPLVGDVLEVEVPVKALISGVGVQMRDGKQWFVLPDDSQVAVTCSDYVGLRDAAADAGIAVVLPGPQPL